MEPLGPCRVSLFLSEVELSLLGFRVSQCWMSSFTVPFQDLFRALVSCPAFGLYLLLWVAGLRA